MRSIHEISTLKDIFDEIRSKNTVTINSETGSLELFGGKYWYNVITRAYATEHHGIDYPCHALGAVGIYPTEMMTDTQRFLKNVLPLDDPPYFDLRHACKKVLGIEHGTPAFGIFFAVLAPIYIRMQNIEFDDKEIRLDIDDNTGLKNQNQRLVLFGLDEMGQPTDFVQSLDLNGTREKRTYSKKIQYSSPFISLNYQLYHDKVLIEDNVIGKNTYL